MRDLGPEADQMEHRKKECEQYINEVGEQLSKYLIKNCKKRSRFNAQSATSYLHAFFKYYGLYVGIDRLEQAKGLTSSQNEVNYYIAQYIFEKKMENSAEYFHILNLVKGYFLQTAIYLQPENGNLVDAKFKDLEIYYDTPILLDLLGYHSDEEKDAAQNLHNALRMKKAKCHYFPYAEQEINAILHAYKRSLEHRDFRRHHWNTLENLNRRNCTPSYIDVLLAKWPNDLNASYNGISEKDFPSHPQKGNGEINWS